MPGPLQKEAVSLSKRLTLTIHFSFPRASLTLPAPGLEQAGFIPQAKNPSNAPMYILTNRASHDACIPSSSFGSQE